MTAIRPCARERARGGGAEVRGDEQVLFERHQQRLLRSVRRAISGDGALVEDACAYAWEELLARQPDRSERLFGWLCTVAIRQAWTLARKERREAGPANVDAGALIECQPAAVDTETALEARLALGALAGLRERERRYLALLVAGHSYKEIASRCGVSYSNVDRHLKRARTRLRALAAETDVPKRTAGPEAGSIASAASERLVVDCHAAQDDTAGSASTPAA